MFKIEFFKKGTSLRVQPFGLLSTIVDEECPRILINRDLVGDFVNSLYNPDDNYRDLFIQADCDEGCLKLAKTLGYLEDLNKLIKEDTERLNFFN